LGAQRCFPEVGEGEVLGLIGRNGSGKTTLLKILSRITQPTAGWAEIHGRVGSLLEVGTGFHPELTGRENTYLSGAILGMRKNEIARKFDEIVAFAELEKFIDTPVKHYSSGMYVRLAFAVAAHLEPEILIVDEVLAVGDAAFQKKCLGKMGDVAGQGRTVLFVSHNMGAVRRLCGRTILLQQGGVRLAGLTEPVIECYLNEGAEEVAAAVALPPGSPDAPAHGTRLCFSADGRAQAQFRLGEPWTITLEFELRSPLPQVSAGVGVSTFTSVPLITYRSKPRDLSAGRYAVRFTCDVPLKSCNLQFAVGLSTQERAIYYADGVGHVSITEVSQEEQPLHSSGDGVLLSRQQPDIEPLIPAASAARAMRA
jgi:lipopolysaccharide transport system ATP-binding protein